MNDLEGVVGVFDMDGFSVERVFYCKELGIWRVGDEYAASYFFDTGLKWRGLSEKDRRQCRYLSRHVHRLPFGVRRGVQTKQLSELSEIVTSFYMRNKGVKKNAVLAYKGGRYERELLEELSIPGIDLERYGCPKAEALFDDLGWLETCGNHIGTEFLYRHCPKVETEAYGNWLLKRV